MKKLLNGEHEPKTPSAILANKKLKEKYASLVGALLYHVGNFSAECCHTVSLLARSMANPGREHWKAALRCLHYLRGRVGFNFKLGNRRACRPVGRELNAFCDADFGNCATTRRSQTGFVVYFHGTPISFCSRRQASVSLSTTDAEVRAATEVTREIMYLRRLLADLGYKQDGPTPVYEDNKATVVVSRDESKQNQTRLRYMEVRDRFVFEACNNGTIELLKVGTDDQVADCLTKTFSDTPAGEVHFHDLRDKLFNPLPQSVLEQPEDERSVYLFHTVPPMRYEGTK